VDGLGKQFFPGTAFATDEHRRFGVGDFADGLHYLANGGAVSFDLAPLDIYGRSGAFGDFLRVGEFGLQDGNETTLIVDLFDFDSHLFIQAAEVLMNFGTVQGDAGDLSHGVQEGEVFGRVGATCGALSEGDESGEFPVEFEVVDEVEAEQTQQLLGGRGFFQEACRDALKREFAFEDFQQFGFTGNRRGCIFNMESGEQVELSAFGVKQVDGGAFHLKHFTTGCEHAIGDGTLVTQATDGPVHPFEGFIELVLLPEEATVDEALDAVARPEQQRNGEQHHQKDRDRLVGTGGTVQLGTQQRAERNDGGIENRDAGTDEVKEHAATDDLIDEHQAVANNPDDERSHKGDAGEKHGNPGTAERELGTVEFGHIN